MWSVLVRAKNKEERYGAIVGSVLALAIFAGIGWGLNTVLNNPLVIAIGELDVKPGATRLSELLSEGYLISDSESGTFSREKSRKVYDQFYDSTMLVEDNTTLRGIILVKGDEGYAYVNVTTGGNTKELADCFVEDIILYEPLLDAEACAIDGIPLEEATVASITEKRGDFEKQSAPNSKGITTISWTKGGYELTIETDPSGKIVTVIAKDHRIIAW